MAFMGRGAPATVVVSSALCKFTSSWLLAPSCGLRRPAAGFRKPAIYLEAFLRYPLRTHIRLERFRNQHAAVGLLIVLHNRHPGAPHGQPAAVQRVHEFGLVLAFRPIADVGAPRLIRFEIRARRNLAEQL